MRRIILIGYMGAGKTTVGHALSKALDMTFYDLDWYIENRRHMTVPQIFDQQGEEGFRKIEHNLLHEVAEFENVIISCGGGTPCFFDNIDYMNEQGSVFYLRATPEVLMQHLKMSRTERPLLRDKNDEELKAFIASQLELREPYYTKARHVVDISVMDSHDSIEATVNEIIRITKKEHTQPSDI